MLLAKENKFKKSLILSKNLFTKFTDCSII
nr:MAG TPA: hypothetical protein [Caudoviricetes sp.]